MKKQSRKIKLSICLLALAALAMSGGVLFAKYMAKDAYFENLVSAEDFFFTTDLLGDTHDAASVNKTIDIYGGAKQDLTFSVKNYFDELRVSDQEIPYTVSMTGYTDARLVEAGNPTKYQPGNTLSRSFSAGGSAQSDEYTIELPRDYENEAEVVLTIQSTEPYQKTMTVTFNLYSSEEEVLYYVKDNGSFIELVIMTNVDLVPGQLLVDWTDINDTAAGNILQVDCTNPYLLTDELTFTPENNPKERPNKYLSHITVSQRLLYDESISIYFFKEDPEQADYDSPHTGDEYQSIQAAREIIEKVDGNEIAVYTVTLKTQGNYTN